MMFVIESSATKVNKFDVGSLHASHVSPLKKKKLFLKHFRMKLILYAKSRFGKSIIENINNSIPFCCYMCCRIPNLRIRCSPV